MAYSAIVILEVCISMAKVENLLDVVGQQGSRIIEDKQVHHGTNKIRKSESY